MSGSDDDQENDFDFRREVIRVYDDAENVEQKLKALALYAKVLPPAPAVNPEKGKSDSLDRIHKKLNGGG